MVPFVKTPTGVNVFIRGKAFPIGTDHPNYSEILNLVLDTETEVEEVEPLVDIKKTLEVHGDGHIVIKGGDVLEYDGVQMHPVLSKRVIALIFEKKDISLFSNFMANLMQNPSYRAVNELYGFLDACSLPITTDGCFLAYKKVRYNYTSLHANPDGTYLDNSIGKSPKMNRNQVDEDPNRTCSKGLHVCSFEYLKHYGGTGTTDTDDRVIICKVNPKDVVSVPADYDNQKMRVCEYQVIDEIPNDGMTQIMDWCFGDRKEGWIRDTLASLRHEIEVYFNITAKYEDNLLSKDVSQAKMDVFLDLLVDIFGLKTTSKSFTDRYAKQVTLKNLLQWVSNYTV